MANQHFSFKQFTIYQHLCAMKVGTDGVLLGAWANTENTKRILDIGTGTGLIALMLAQRTNAQIDAIDIDNDAVLQALDNVKNSPWCERINVYKTALQDFRLNETEKYDLIVSNPPYFNNSLKAPKANRTIARHTASLTHVDLLEHSKRLMTENGIICLILPVNEGLKIIDLGLNNGLFCNKMVYVHPTPNSKPIRLLLELSKIKNKTSIDSIEIETNVRHEYSSDFNKLVRGFYLKL